ncbi:hypothetical protein [Deinococcus daejeonensis]|nr:hypothetical protein [Deinococcus daejeonensis]
MPAGTPDSTTPSTPDAPDGDPGDRTSRNFGGPTTRGAVASPST